MNTLDKIENEAQRFLETLREKPDNGILRQRLQFHDPTAPATPELRHIQHTLARERGFESWAALEAALAAPTRDTGPGPGRGRGAAPDREARIASFLDDACWDHHVHGRGDFAMNEAAALRALAKEPDLARANLYTAIVCGEIDEMRRLLDAEPALINVKGGSRRWEPLLYLCYARLPLPALRDQTLPMARELLDRGANPAVYYMAGDSIYGALVGVAGEGEQDAYPHVQRDALYALLLERGAGPFDIQVLYNTFFRGHALWWLELTYAHTLATGQADAWKQPDWPMLDMGGYGSGARFLLETSINKGDVTLAEWLLAHGANPNAAPRIRQANRHFSRRTLYAEAVRQGRDEIAHLLLRYGATPETVVLDDEDALTLAALRLDREAARVLIERHPEFRQAHASLFEAARRDRADAVALLLDLGVSIEAEDESKQRALHHAAGDNALRAAALLIERGAEIDPIEDRFGGAPIGFAAHYDDRPMIDLLTPVSRHMWTLVHYGKVERVRALLAEEPALATVASPEHITLLWWLPDDEARALEIVELLLAHGADPATKSSSGSTAADYARTRGLDRVADRLTQ